MRHAPTVINIYQSGKRSFCGGMLEAKDEALFLTASPQKTRTGLYLTPGWIDAHTHVYAGGGELGISPELAGLKRGVHLLVDAGSAGVSNVGALRDCIALRTRTKIRAFLNISVIGLASGQPYHDMRLVDPEKAARCILEDAGGFFLGIKVLASRKRVEEAGLEPLRLAVKAAEMAGCRMMVHLAEGPPYNDETMPLLRRGDIISHCFHGDKYRIGRSNIMWKPDGSPVPALRDALDRGVIIDVGHGSASLRADIARSVVGSGMRDFIISTDLHSGNLNGPVWSLAETMSKFFSFGMTLGEVVHAVTEKPAKALGIKNWGDDLCRQATIFRLRKVCETDPTLKDSLGTVIAADERIEPVAVVLDGKIIDIIQNWRATV